MRCHAKLSTAAIVSGSPQLRLHRGMEEDAPDDVTERRPDKTPKWTAARAPAQEGTAYRFRNENLTNSKDIS